MKGVVDFDVNDFKLYHRGMEEVPKEELQALFKSACLLLNNTLNSIVTDLEERKLLLYLLVCHLYQLAERGGEMVGQMTGASQGKVSISITGIANANWYQQTQCGALFWQATAKYRRGVRYIAPNCRNTFQ